MIEPPDLKAMDGAAKDALILALIDRINALLAENAELRERIARLEARLGKPPRTPDRKITQCFRSQWSPRLYADVRSVLETARRRAINQLLAIQITLAGQPLFVDTG